MGSEMCIRDSHGGEQPQVVDHVAPAFDNEFLKVLMTEIPLAPKLPHPTALGSVSRKERGEIIVDARIHNSP